MVSPYLFGYLGESTYHFANSQRLHFVFWVSPFYLYPTAWSGPTEYFIIAL